MEQSLPIACNTSAHFSPSSNLSIPPSVSTHLSSSTQVPRLWNVTDKLLIDAYESLRMIYEDMFQINELINIKKGPALVPEGMCMLFNGYIVVNSLEPKFVSKVVQKVKVDGLG